MMTNRIKHIILTTIIVSVLFAVSTVSAETLETVPIGEWAYRNSPSCTYGEQCRFRSAIQYRWRSRSDR